MNPIRLLLTIPNLDTVSQKHVVADLVYSLDRSRVVPSLCVFQLKGTALERKLADAVESFIVEDLRVARIPLSRFVHRTREVAEGFRGKFDLVHSFDFSNDWSEPWIFRTASIPWVYTKTNMNALGLRGHLRLHFARKVVCLSSKQMQMCFPSPLRRKVSSIPIGIDLLRFAAIASEEARERLNIPKDCLALGCVANLVPLKGHLALVEAFAQVALRNPRLNLYLVGRDVDGIGNRVRGLAARLGIETRVHLLGSRDDVPLFLSAMDGVVLSTRREGMEAFGTALVEAMAASRPVIATRSGGPEDIVIDSETGWLVGLDDHDDLSCAIEDWAGDSLQRSVRGLNGLLRARREYDRILMAQRHIQLYDNLLDRE